LRRSAARRAALGIAVTALLAAAGARAADDGWTKLRRTMVDEQIRGRGITAPGVLSAMGQVPRHMFVPLAEQGRSYADQPLPFDSGRTIYQPYVVALMTSLLDLDGSKRVLEIGTGSGYHAAVLSRIAREVYSIEISEPVANQAEKRLATMGYVNVHVRSGDGYRGWPEKAPFDAILVSAAPPKIPKPLLDQLRVGGKMVVAQGGFVQDLLVITKTADGLEKRTVIPVRLSPMTGKIRDGG
jgi:protein-L-isoaspartate(D-aspartate) O-methyltransferase